MLPLAICLAVAALGGWWFWGRDLAPAWAVSHRPAADWATVADARDGFRLSHPPEWQVRSVFPGLAIILADGRDAKLTVQAQPLGRVSAREYVLYSNRSLLDGLAGIKVTASGKSRFRGRDLWWFEWQRESLGPDDQNHYLEYHLIRGQMAYSFMLKARREAFARASGQLKGVLLSLAVGAGSPAGGPPGATGPAGATGNSAAPDQRLAVSVEADRLELVIPEDKTMWGIMTSHTLGTRDLLPKVRALEDKLDYRFGMLSTYLSFGTRLDLDELRLIHDDERFPMVAIQPWRLDQAGQTALIDLIKGEYDDLLRDWAAKIASTGKPVFVRFGNEMNGDWSTWCAWFYGKDTDIFKLAWQHVRAVFDAEGADNAVFVFNPHDRSFPDFEWNHPLLYYPGDEAVDWIGLTGYNNGVAHEGDEWRGFREIYDPLYQEYLSYWPRMPLMITEFATNESGGNKAAWIDECLTDLPVRYPRIKIAIWFDKQDGLWLYQLESSAASLEAFGRGLQRPAYDVRPRLKEG